MFHTIILVFCFTIWLTVSQGAGMAQWWEHSPPLNVARVRFPGSVSYVGWVCCWFSSLLWEVFLWVLRFSLLLKNLHFQIPILSGECSYTVKRIWSSRHGIMRYTNWRIYFCCCCCCLLLLRKDKEEHSHRRTKLLSESHCPPSRLKRNGTHQFTKRPMNAFMLFAQRFRLEITQAHPGKDNR